MLKSKDFWKAAFIRAFKTICQTLLSTIPVGFTITPIMLQNADWTILWTVAAWFGTGLLSGLISLLTNIVTGLPEVNKT